MKVKSESAVAQVVYLKVIQSCPTHSDPMDCSLPGSSVHGNFQARVLEWGAIAFSTIYDRYYYSLLDSELVYLLKSNRSFSILESWCLGKMTTVISLTNTILLLKRKKKKKVQGIPCCSVTQSCPTMCDPMDSSTPGFPVCHLLELAEIHIH